MVPVRVMLKAIEELASYREKVNTYVIVQDDSSCSSSYLTVFLRYTVCPSAHSRLSSISNATNWK